MFARLRLSLTASAAMSVLFLSAVNSAAYAQTVPQSAAAVSPPQASAATAEIAASSQGAGVAAAPASAAGSAPISCAACPQSANLEQVLQRMEAAASATQAAASAAAAGGDSAWKTVFLNVFSNRVDSLLFGSGEAGRGLIPILAGVLSLVAAAIKLLLAYLARKQTSPRSDFAKAVDVWLAGYLVLAAGVALWALFAAKSSADAATAPTEALSTALNSCTAELKAGRGGSTTSPASPDRQVLAELQNIRAACVATAADQATELSAIAKSTKSIASDQHGFLFNLLVIAAAFGVFALVYKAFRD